MLLPAQILQRREVHADAGVLARAAGDLVHVVFHGDVGRGSTLGAANH